MSLLGYHGFNNWENHFMEDENERDNILFGFELEAREDDSNYVENQLSPEQVACKLGEEFGNFSFSLVICLYMKETVLLDEE